MPTTNNDGDAVPIGLSGGMTREELFKKIKEGLPADANISGQRFEGASVILFTKNRSFLTVSGEFVKPLAKTVKKRIEVRADSSILMELEDAIEKIKKMVPEEAEVNSIDFDPHASRVLIEAGKPGLVIGKGGQMLLEIKKETCWTPFIFRTPPLKSDIINTIRHTTISNSKARADFLNRAGERVYNGIKPPKWVRVSALGGFREVGRSCVLLQTPESRILLDCGVNVASDENAYPYLEAGEFDVTKLDAVIITHAHLDHGGLVPILFKYGYQGPVYCTTATQALMGLLQLDFIDVVQGEGKNCPYTANDIKQEMLHTINLEYGEVTDITPDLRITLYNAGHILGSATVHIHVGDGAHNIVYTGDLKYERTRLLEAATNRFPRCETLIMESTYGAPGDIQQDREVGEVRISEIITETINRGGKVLIPVLGVGRSQELMIILEELVRTKKLPEVPVYLEGMMWDATAIHTTYPEFLSNEVRNAIFGADENPFLSPIFKRVGGRAEREEVITGGPCVIMATSGMLVGGPSVEYLKQMCDEPKNSLIFINYQGEGSLGKKIQGGWKRLPLSTKEGKHELVEVRMEIHTVAGFSAHADRRELVNYVGRMQNVPKLVIINHGEASKCVNLSRHIAKRFRTESVAPKNLETVRLK